MGNLFSGWLFPPSSSAQDEPGGGAGAEVDEAGDSASSTTPASGTGPSSLSSASASGSPAVLGTGSFSSSSYASGRTAGPDATRAPPARGKGTWGNIGDKGAVNAVEGSPAGPNAKAKANANANANAKNPEGAKAPITAEGPERPAGANANNSAAGEEPKKTPDLTESQKKELEKQKIKDGLASLGKGAKQAYDSVRNSPGKTKAAFDRAKASAQHEYRSVAHKTKKGMEGIGKALDGAKSSAKEFEEGFRESARDKTASFLEGSERSFNNAKDKMKESPKKAKDAFNKMRGKRRGGAPATKGRRPTTVRSSRGGRRDSPPPSPARRRTTDTRKEGRKSEDDPGRRGARQTSASTPSPPLRRPPVRRRATAAGKNGDAQRRGRGSKKMAAYDIRDVSWTTAPCPSCRTTLR